MATLLACTLYVLIFLSIGVIAHRRYTTAGDFILGGRSMNFWVTALGAHVSDMSGWLLMGFPMAVYTLGLGQAWIAVGLCLGMLCNWHFVAPKLRTQTEETSTYTLSSFFARRFGDKTGLIRLVSAVLMFLFLCHYLSAGLISMGFLLESLFHIDYQIGITLAMLAVMLHCFYGGYVAVAWTDLFQGTFLLAMVMLVPLVALTQIPLESIAQTASEKAIPLSFVPPGGPKAVLSFFLLSLSWGLGYFGSPHILLKFMGIKDVQDMRKSKYVGITWQILALGSAVLVGVVGIGFFRHGLANPELVYVEMVQQLFPAGMAAFILCAILAAIITTMDSQILVLSAILTEDFYIEMFRKKASDREQLWVSRFSVLIVCVAAWMLALPGGATILDTVTYSWMGLGASFGPPVLAALYFPRATPLAVMCGIVAGGITTALSGWFTIEPAGVAIPPMIIAFALNGACILGITKMSKAKKT